MKLVFCELDWFKAASGSVRVSTVRYGLRTLIRFPVILCVISWLIVYFFGYLSGTKASLSDSI